MKTPPLHLREYLSGFLHLLYPVLCVSCNNALPGGSSCFCVRCRLRLEPVPLENGAENELTERLWGRLPIAGGAALYYFHRKSPVQKALHGLKYRNKADIGTRLGQELGRKMKTQPLFSKIDAIVPVPLHPSKERLRGYNQSAMLAQGIAEVLDRPVLSTGLVRNTATESQTHKHRIERFINVEEVFTAPKPALLHNKHILLVDDVLTTGATLEVCGQALFKAGIAQLSIATIAIAMNRNY